MARMNKHMHEYAPKKRKGIKSTWHITARIDLLFFNNHEIVAVVKCARDIS